MTPNQIAALSLFFAAGVFTGSAIVYSKPSTTYNNTQAVTDCATTLNRCMEGWRETLDTLNSCNNLIK